MREVRQAEAVRSAPCQRWEEEALGSVSHRRVGKARCYWRRPSAASHRVARTKPGFPRATNLSRSWRQASLKSWRGEFPALGISHLPEEPFSVSASLPSRILREHPAERAGAAGGAAAIPGRREEAGARLEDAESRAGWRR